VSNLPIPTTLDTDASDVEANEVAVLDEDGDGAFDDDDEASETFANLSASVIEQLFNNDGTYDGFAGDDADYGSLNAGDFSVADYDKDSVNEDLIGDAKAILMVENFDNLGEYKVFELTWDGDEDLTEQVVTARDLGSLDFGTTLVDLSEVNLVGSEEYNTLLEDGFFAP